MHNKIIALCLICSVLGSSSVAFATTTTTTTTTTNSTLNNNTSIQATAVAGTSAFSYSYMHVKYTWWGAQVYFSHQAVIDVNDYLVGGGTAAGIGTIIGNAGIKLASGYLGAIALAGTPLFWAMSKMDKGNGMYLNCVLYVPATMTAA